MMNKSSSRLPEPKFLHELDAYPNMDPIFIAIDWQCCHFIRRLKGVCLLWDYSISNLNLTFSFAKEVWVLYSNSRRVDSALHLARKIQLAGAKNVSLIFVERAREAQ